MTDWCCDVSSQWSAGENYANKISHIEITRNLWRVNLTIDFCIAMRSNDDGPRTRNNKSNFLVSNSIARICHKIFTRNSIIGSFALWELRVEKEIFLIDHSYQFRCTTFSIFQSSNRVLHALMLIFKSVKIKREFLWTARACNCESSIKNASTVLSRRSRANYMIHKPVGSLPSVSRD